MFDGQAELSGGTRHFARQGLKMEAKVFSKMSLPSGQTIRCHITEDRNLDTAMGNFTYLTGGLGPCSKVVGSSVDIVVPSVAQS